MHEFRELLVGAMAWGGLLVLIMGVCAENLSSDVVVVKSAKDGV